MPEDESKPDQAENDPEKLSRLLELELIQKRAAWQRAGARYKTLKTASLLFLAVVILAGLLAFFLIFLRVSERGVHPRQPVQQLPARP
jgi:hypothetical protein